MGEYRNIKITNIERNDPQETPCTLPQDKQQEHCVIANAHNENKVPRGENVHQSRDSMNEKLPLLPHEAERESALRMSSPSKKVAKSEVVKPRSSLLRKSVRVDRGDGGPPSDVKRWENCAAQESSKCH